jgi:uncharacterized protein YggE
MFEMENLKKILGVLAAIFLVTLSANNVKKFTVIGTAPQVPHAITVSGTGKITATPTIAITTVGVVTEKNDVASAQAENTTRMNALIAAVDALGIPKADVQTSQYQLYPKYSYDQKNGSQITGYSVSQSVTIKIRDLAKISAVLAKVGEVGVNQVSGIQFTFDDPKILQEQVREKAVADAKEKATKLAVQLGVTLGRVIGFSENGNNAPMPLFAYAKESAAPAPDIQPGALDIASNIDITFELQ